MNINNHKLKKLDNITNYLYFLFYKNKLVYIGQTNNINKRLVDHRRKDNSYTATNKKIFDRYYAISSISDKITKKWEKILIKKLKPKYNIGHDKDAKYKKKWIKRKWSDKKIKKFKNFYLNHINMICNSKQGYYRLVKKN